MLQLARAGKEKGIADALNQHFLTHPFAEVAKQLETDAAGAVLTPFFVRDPGTLPALPQPTYGLIANTLKAAE